MDSSAPLVVLVNFIISRNISIIHFRDEFGGDPSKFLEFYVPHKGCFIAFLRKHFQKISKFEVLCPAIFFEEFPKIS